MEDYIFPFEKLEVWNLSVDFADYVLKVLESFPENKCFRLIGQMEAAVASVAQNIAEGKTWSMDMYAEVMGNPKEE